MLANVSRVLGKKKGGLSVLQSITAAFIKKNADAVTIPSRSSVVDRSYRIIPSSVPFAWFVRSLIQPVLHGSHTVRSRSSSDVEIRERTRRSLLRRLVNVYFRLIRLPLSQFSQSSHTCSGLVASLEQNAHAWICLMKSAGSYRRLTQVHVVSYIVLTL